MNAAERRVASPSVKPTSPGKPTYIKSDADSFALFKVGHRHPPVKLREPHAGVRQSSPVIADFRRTPRIVTFNRMTPSPTRLIQSSTVKPLPVAIHGCQQRCHSAENGVPLATSLPLQTCSMIDVVCALPHNFPSTGIYSSGSRVRPVCLRYDPQRPVAPWRPVRRR